MALFRERHSGYKGGVALFFVSVVIFLIGFGSPNWTTVVVRMSGLSVRTHNGLWVACVSSDGLGGVSLCVSTSTSTEAGTWYTAVQALQCIALIGFFIAGCYALVVNCLRNNRAFSRILEILMACSSVVGLVGACVYGVKQGEARELGEQMAAQHNIDTDTEHVAWAFFVAVLGCVLVLVAAVLVAIFNHRLPAAPDPPSMAFHSPGVVFGPPGTASGFPAASAPYMTAHPANVPYVITNSANPPPPYYIAGQPMAAVNGASQPSFGGPQPVDDAALGALAGPPPVVSDADITVNGWK